MEQETDMNMALPHNLFLLLVLSLDVIGVCKSVEDVTRITTKNSREVSKRNIQLMDMSGKIIQVTMWGNEVSLAHPGGAGKAKAGLCLCSSGNIM